LTLASAAQPITLTTRPIDGPTLTLTNRGMPGPSGPAGATGPVGPAGPSGASAVASYVATFALSGHRVVRAVSGGVDYCDAMTPLHANALLGVTAAAASALDSVDVHSAGNLTEPSWSWIVGMPIFCGPNGTLTQTFDPSWAWCRVVGVALSATTIAVQIREPIFQIA